MKTIKNLKADEIRKSILQLAIQGKLVKQDPNDEPASELVKRIYAEKQKLIKEGKIKKDKNESFIFKGDDNCYYEKNGNNEPIKLEDLPFDLPDSWTWIRLKSISVLNGGYAFKSEKFSNEGIRVIRISDFDENGIKNKDIKRYPYSSDLDSYQILPKDILLCMTGGTVGKSAYIKFLEEDCYINQRVALIRIQNVNVDYFYSVLCSSYISNVINTSKTSTNDNISMKLIEDFLIPLPPMNEQLRIIAKLNSCEPLINQYYVAEEKLSKLEDEFPEQLKKSILQYAIEGKLVKQDPNDEPASVLLERIKAEKEKLIKEGKIKRDRNESTIYQGDDKNYYENMPLNWEYVPLKKCGTLTRGSGIKRNETKTSGYPCIRYGELYTTYKTSFIKAVSAVDFEVYNLSHKIRTNDIVMTLTGENKQDISMALAYLGCDDVAMGGDMSCLSNHQFDPLYLVFVLNSPYGISVKRKLATGDIIVHMSNDRLGSIGIPVPPLKEQHMIVSKVNKIFKVIE